MLSSDEIAQGIINDTTLGINAGRQMAERLGDMRMRADDQIDAGFGQNFGEFLLPAVRTILIFFSPVQAEDQEIRTGLPHGSGLTGESAAAFRPGKFICTQAGKTIDPGAPGRRQGKAIEGAESLSSQGWVFVGEGTKAKADALDLA